jgi:ketosteroid isomerase-like protein
VTGDVTRAIIGKLHDAFARGDQEGFASFYDDDVEWTFHAPITIFPFAGRRVGKAAVFASLRDLYADYRIEAFAPQLMLAEADRAAVISEVALSQRASGRIIRCRVVSVYRLRGGRVVEYEGFLDSFDAVEQVLGRYVQV